MIKNINFKKIKGIVALGVGLSIASTPIMGKAFSYKIQKGDSLSKISTKFYGDYSYYPMLAEYNNIADPSKIYAGSVIEIPDLDVLLNNGIIYYEIQKGDTLAKISKNFYGDMSFYHEIAVYNKIEDARKIYAKEIIMVPRIEVLLDIRNNQNNNQTTLKDLYAICREVYGSEEYVYLIAALNDCNMYQKYNKEDLFLPSKEVIEIYMDLWKNLEPEDTIKNYYVVEKGDSLSKISMKRYNTMKYVDFLVHINGIQNRDLIHTGDILYVPGMYQEKTNSTRSK